MKETKIKKILAFLVIYLNNFKPDQMGVVSN